jgi:hypothetical protein
MCLIFLFFKFIVKLRNYLFGFIFRGFDFGSEGMLAIDFYTCISSDKKNIEIYIFFIFFLFNL